MSIPFPAARAADAPLVCHRPGAIGIALGGLLALASGMGIGRFVYTPILPVMAQALELSRASAGLIASANFLGYLAGALLAALPLFAAGRRGWFLAALATGAAAMACMAVTEAMPVFLALRFAGGIASAFVLVLGSALVIERLGAAGRPGLAALHFAGVGAGIAVSAVLVDVLAGMGGGWRVLWLGSAAAAACAVPLCAWLIPAGTPVRQPAIRQDAGPAGRAGLLAGLYLCHGLFGFGYVVTATFLVAAVRGTPEARLLEPVVWLVVGLAAIPSTALWSRIGARHGALSAYALACAVEAAGVAAGGLWTGPTGALLAALLLGGTFMGITALGFAAGRELAPAAQRRAFALMTAAFGLGQAAGPVVAGWLADRTHDFAAASLLAAAALVLAAGLAWRLAGAPLPARI